MGNILDSHCNQNLKDLKAIYGPRFIHVLLSTRVTVNWMLVRADFDHFDASEVWRTRLNCRNGRLSTVNYCDSFMSCWICWICWIRIQFPSGTYSGIPVVPHKAVAEVSDIGNQLERLVVVNHGGQSESTDGPKGGWSCVFWSGCNGCSGDLTTTAGCSAV